MQLQRCHQVTEVIATDEDAAAESAILTLAARMPIRYSASMLTSFANRAHAAYPLPRVLLGRGEAMNV